MITPGYATSFGYRPNFAAERRVRTAPIERGGFLEPFIPAIKRMRKKRWSPARIAWMIEPQVDRFYKGLGQDGAKVRPSEIEVLLWHLDNGPLAALPEGMGEYYRGELRPYVGQMFKMREAGSSPREIAEWVAWYQINSAPYETGRLSRAAPTADHVSYVLRKIREKPRPPKKRPEPWLTGPWNGYGPGKHERNRQVVLLRRAGWSLRKIGNAIGLSGDRIHQICAEWRARWPLSDLDIYYATLDGIADQAWEQAKFEREMARLIQLNRPLDMGGPRDVWLGEEVFA